MKTNICNHCQKPFPVKTRAAQVCPLCKVTPTDFHGLRHFKITQSPCPVKYLHGKVVVFGIFNPNRHRYFWITVSQSIFSCVKYFSMTDAKPFTRACNGQSTDQDMTFFVHVFKVFPLDKKTDARFYAEKLIEYYGTDILRKKRHIKKAFTIVPEQPYYRHYPNTLIYALIDPRNNEIFYVGRTRDIKARMSSHAQVKRHLWYSEAFKKQDLRKQAICASGFPITMRILDSREDEGEGAQSEENFIKKYQRTLLNSKMMPNQNKK